MPIIDGLHGTMFMVEDEEIHPDTDGARQDVALALNSPLEFLKLVARDLVHHFDAAHMVSDNQVTEAEAAELVTKALANLKLTREELQSL